MTVKEAIAIMCQRCLNHHMCMGTGCLPKKTLEESIRPSGKWIGKPLAGRCRVRCSNCKDVFAENNGLWNFCPHCGADMRGD